MKDLIEKALQFATKAHEGQFRKGPDKQPFISHPVAVSDMAANAYLIYIVPEEPYVVSLSEEESQSLDETRIIGLLHDTIEDTEVTFEDIKNKFGDYIAESVEILTKSKEDSYFDYFKNIVSSEYLEAKMVKLADLTHNLEEWHGDRKGSKYEKKQLAKWALERELLIKL